MSEKKEIVKTIIRKASNLLKLIVEDENVDKDFRNTLDELDDHVCQKCDSNLIEHYITIQGITVGLCESCTKEYV